MAKITNFKTWKTIKIGTPTLRTAEDFLKALNGARHEVHEWAKDIMERPDFTVRAEETKLNLVIVSVSELGFSDGATRKQIFDRAISLGLEICPAEVGPQLRLQYMELEEYWLQIGMEPITDSEGFLHVFSVARRHGRESWLRSNFGDPDRQWAGLYQWVFILPD